MKQLPLDLPTWGGKRKGAGRPPKGERPLVSHLQRKQFPARHPVHVTMRMRREAGFLRSARRYRAIERALRAACELHGVRIIHFSVQGNHLHLLVEAKDARALAQAMQSLAVRLVWALRRATGLKGPVFADRYHSRSLATRREVANALNYVLCNFLHHLREDVAPQGLDPCSSAAAPLVTPHTWLLRNCGRDHAPPSP